VSQQEQTQQDITVKVSFFLPRWLRDKITAIVRKNRELSQLRKLGQERLPTNVSAFIREAIQNHLAKLGE
jgi:hypothetical protein